MPPMSARPALAALAKVDAGLAQLDEERNRIERQSIESVTRRCSCSRRTTTCSPSARRSPGSSRTRRSGWRCRACSRRARADRARARGWRRCCRCSPRATTAASRAGCAIAAGARDRQQFLATATTDEAAVFEELRTTPRWSHRTCSVRSTRASSSRRRSPTRRSWCGRGYLRRTSGNGAARRRHHRGHREHRRTLRGLCRERPSRRVDVRRPGRRRHVGDGRADVDRRPCHRPTAAQAHRERRTSPRTSCPSSSSSCASEATCRRCSSHVEVSSEDEIGELAQAFENVQTVTFDVAQEQSRLLRKGMGDLFVNLARRNQSLLERQLELLDELERNEHDPSALDSLFKLDHMATHAPAGEPPRALGRRAAAPVAAAHRAARRRARGRRRDRRLPRASSSASTTTSPSPGVRWPTSRTSSPSCWRTRPRSRRPSPRWSCRVRPPHPACSRCRTRASGCRPSGCARPTISRPAAAHGPLPLAALGLHVVGSLAARHGITVELRPGAPVGLVALITLPATVLERTGAKVPPAGPVLRPTAPDGEPTPLWPAGWRGDRPTSRRSSSVARDRTGPSTGRRHRGARLLRRPARRAGGARAGERADRGRPAAARPAHVPGRPSPSRPCPSRRRPRRRSATHGSTRRTSPKPIRPPTTTTSTTSTTRRCRPACGQHLRHQPLVDRETPAAEADDPLRPYRVHELLTRHDLGKRRGRGEAPADGHGRHDGARDPGAGNAGLRPVRPRPGRVSDDAAERQQHELVGLQLRRARARREGEATIVSEQALIALSEGLDRTATWPAGGVRGSAEHREGRLRADRRWAPPTRSSSRWCWPTCSS